jgi:uncharacterized protein (DUF302 family)
MLMKQAWRYWSTGGIAVVLASASQAQGAGERSRSMRGSRYSLDETATRLERLARARGFEVFARVEPPQTRQASEPQQAAALLLVLGTDAAHTPVLQSSPSAPLDLPLTMRIEQHRGGDTEVHFSDSNWLAEHAGLPAELIDRVAALPALVDAALDSAQ